MKIMDETAKIFLKYHNWSASCIYSIGDGTGIIIFLHIYSDVGKGASAI